MDVPVYLFTGFLDAGKTKFIQETLEDARFNTGERTLLVMCEEGEEEYNPDTFASGNVFILPIEDQSELTEKNLAAALKKYRCQRVLVEYNGMWPIQILRDLKLPKRWGLYQAIDVIDGTTFELYRSNMQSMIVDMATEADLVLFNRCTPDMELSSWKRSIRAVNQRCEIVFENEMGEELEVEDILPYSLEDAHITLEDTDYGIWYIDIQEHPERYIGKTITYKAQAMTGMRLPKGTFVPGRNAMTCCEDDIRFFGFLCKWDKVRSLKKGEWITVTAQIKWEEANVYDGEGVVLYASSVEKAERPKDPLVYFV